MDSNKDPFISATAPVETIPTDKPTRLPDEGIALCLSGGGYRAMLFHLGTLWRLNDAGYLPKLDRVSSVSGGSITAAYLAYKWDRLEFDVNGVSSAFEQEVVTGIRRIAKKTIDVKSVLTGLFWTDSIGEKVAKQYKKHLFGDATLQSLPDVPRFVINATNVQSGALWRFSKPYMRDWRVGEIKHPLTSLSLAVAASSAFPPVLSPLAIPLDPKAFTPNTGVDLQKEPFISTAVLSDGGVYDNLGLETAWKRYSTVLVSDAGGQMQTEGKPKRDWVCHSYRVLNLIDNQVRALRKRQLIESYKLHDKLLAEGKSPDDPFVRRVSREGAYWGIRTDIADYQLEETLPCPHDKTLELANISTRLAKLPDKTQKMLINWGYAVCDAALRKHVDPTLPIPGDFPYAVGVG